jgi:hypothetical protein
MPSPYGLIVTSIVWIRLKGGATWKVRDATTDDDRNLFQHAGIPSGISPHRVGYLLDLRTWVILKLAKGATVSYPSAVCPLHPVSFLSEIT